jgi:hypothetical protein
MDSQLPAIHAVITQAISALSESDREHLLIPASRDVAIEKILAALAATRDGLGNPSATP